MYLEEVNTRDVDSAATVFLTNGVRYTDLRVGGGAQPQRGDLVIVALTATASTTSTGDSPAAASAGAPADLIVEASSQPPLDTVTFIDTTAPGARDIVFSFASRPFPRGVTEGMVAAMGSMRAGGRRKIVVPAAAGFGQDGEMFDGGMVVPGGAVLEYVVELKRVSIPPS